MFLEKRLCQFLNIRIIYHRATNQKKTKDPFLRKMPKNGDPKKIAQANVLKFLEKPHERGPRRYPFLNIEPSAIVFLEFPYNPPGFLSGQDSCSNQQRQKF